MKKILTLAVALVMVFALAAPALAAGWDYTPAPDEFDDLYLNITALDVDYYSDTMFDNGYKKLDKTYPVVAGMKVHAYAEVEIPNNLSPNVLQRIKEGQGLLTIDTINLENVTIYVRQGENAPYQDNSGKYAVVEASLGKTFYFEIWGTVVKSDKDAKITATLGVYNQWDANEEFDFFNKSGKEYTIDKNGNEYWVIRADQRDVGVAFYTNSDGVVQNILVSKSAGDTYYAINNFNGDLAFVDSDDTTIQISGDTYRDVKAILDEICGAMGFDYAGQAFITKDLIKKYLGNVVEPGTISLVYPSGYVQPIDPTDPGVNPPQTGDNASVVGFVMIAVALVAAAVVTVKKVRA